MPLTPSEKSKRYREKLKRENPEKYEEKRLKNLARIKSKKKKIADMTDAEKEQKRKIWREEKKKKKNLSLSKESGPIPTSDTSDKSSSDYLKLIKSLRIKNKKWSQLYDKAQEKIRNQNNNIELLRKRLRRVQCRLQGKENDYEKLSLSVKSAYSKTRRHEHKQVFKNITNTIHSKGKKTFLTKCLGLKSNIRRKPKLTKQSKYFLEIKMFFDREDVSRSSAGKKETKTKNKNKYQIRYLNESLQNLFKVYRSEEGKASFATFCRYKPIYVLTPNVNRRETCLCIKHENMELKLKALRKYKILGFTLKEYVQSVSCDVNSYECMYGLCTKCKNIEIKYDECRKNEELTWNQWERVDHVYEKNSAKKTKEEVVTKKVVKSIKRAELQKIIQVLCTDTTAFKIHCYNMRHQYTVYKQLSTKLAYNEVAIHCDFSENFLCKYGTQIQSAHFGASQNQISLHTGIVHFPNGKTQSFCTISSNNKHQPAAIWAHLVPIIKSSIEKDPKINAIHMFSDGPSSQYRQKNNFYLINRFQFILGLKYITWSFFESGHGKGVPDGIGAVIKRSLDRHIAYGNDVLTAQSAYEVVSEKIRSVQCVLISDEEINRVSKKVPNNLKAIQGTLKIHQIISQQPGIIYHRTLSCFCNREKCSCFSPKKHKFKSDEDCNKASPLREVNSPKGTNRGTYTTLLNDIIDESFSKENEYLNEIISHADLIAPPINEIVFEDDGLVIPCDNPSSSGTTTGGLTNSEDINTATSTTANIITTNDIFNKTSATAANIDIPTEELTKISTSTANAFTSTKTAAATVNVALNFTDQSKITTAMAADNITSADKSTDASIFNSAIDTYTKINSTTANALTSADEFTKTAANTINALSSGDESDEEFTKTTSITVNAPTPSTKLSTNTAAIPAKSRIFTGESTNSVVTVANLFKIAGKTMKIPATGTNFLTSAEKSTKTVTTTACALTSPSKSTKITTTATYALTSASKFIKIPAPATNFLTSADKSTKTATTTACTLISPSKPTKTTTTAGYALTSAGKCTKTSATPTRFLTSPSKSTKTNTSAGYALASAGKSTKTVSTDTDTFIKTVSTALKSPGNPNRSSTKRLNDFKLNSYIVKVSKKSSNRTFTCAMCKLSQQMILTEMAMCIACKKWHCMVCSENQTSSIDYICNACFGI